MADAVCIVNYHDYDAHCIDVPSRRQIWTLQAPDRAPARQIWRRDGKSMQI